MPGSTRSAARGFLEELVKRGWGSSQIQDWLRQAGYGYRRADLLADIREIKGIEARAVTFRSIRLTALPTPRTVHDTTKHLARPFLFTARVNFYDPVTGQSGYHYYSMPLSKLRTRGVLEQRLIELASQQAKQYGFVVTGLEGQTVVHRAGADFAYEPDDAEW
jgi:hypothetical protein